MTPEIYVRWQGNKIRMVTAEGDGGYLGCYELDTYDPGHVVDRLRDMTFTLPPKKAFLASCAAISLKRLLDASEAWRRESERPRGEKR